ncbi:Oidioi.mRNA.OKI2018_I69.chr1.g1323.t1.cds [Oikopleura dioica]|uniref:Oidioi.mRNA.OKI2018_I69.chr1.g1323.t1.cds n=1 Tax=Oikopleura dioica TaxID=34765 RepID=A0ABN7SN27_OIKDI|nr:Oidioi.mRNA.OKI2018_I69.chr1.g1323.t1.cds [Oikopleura dioica]
MESDGETFKLIIKTMGDSSIPIEINGDAKILELKEKIQAALENIQNEDVLERDNQRIIFRGRLLNNDLKIKDIQNLEREGGVMHVVRLNIPAPGRNDPTAAQRENLEQMARNELVMAKIRSLETLLKNADQCVSYSQRNTNWNERRELQEPENLGEGVMSVKDFGNVAEDFGESMFHTFLQKSNFQQ